MSSFSTTPTTYLSPTPSTLTSMITHLYLTSQVLCSCLLHHSSISVHCATIPASPPAPSVSSVEITTKRGLRGRALPTEGQTKSASTHSPGITSSMPASLGGISTFLASSDDSSPAGGFQEALYVLERLKD